MWYRNSMWLGLCSGSCLGLGAVLGFQLNIALNSSTSSTQGFFIFLSCWTFGTLLWVCVRTLLHSVRRGLRLAASVAVGLFVGLALGLVFGPLLRWWLGVGTAFAVLLGMLGSGILYMSVPISGELRKRERARRQQLTSDRVTHKVP